MITALQNVFRIEELRTRILFSAAMIAVYRVGCIVVTPGINGDVIRQFFESMSGTMFGLLNVFSGGAMESLSIFALGIMPYISSSIIFQLLTIVIPALEKLKKEGSEGQKRITQWTRYSTIGLALFQSFLMAMALENGQFGQGAVIVPGWAFRITTMITLTSGTAFIMWLGEQVTEQGIGNGVSLIIFAGIVERLPGASLGLIQLVKAEEIGLIKALIIVAVVLAVVLSVVWVETAQRKIPVQYAKRVVGRKMYGGASSFLPLKVDQSGVIAVIFAVSLMAVPMTIAQFTPNSPWAQKILDFLNRANPIYELCYAALIVFFCYFYNSVSINPTDLAENMKKSGGFVPGMRPGEPTAKYIEWVLDRITLGGALFVAAVAVLPTLLRSVYNVPFYLGGTSLLIVEGVALDTMGQLEAHLIMRHYEGFLKGGRIRQRWFNVGN